MALSFVEPAITANQLNVGVVVKGIVSVAFSATPTFNAALGDYFTMTATANVTSQTVTNATPGQMITIQILQDATGGRTVAGLTNAKYGWGPATGGTATNIAGSTPPGSATGAVANYYQVSCFFYNGTNFIETARAFECR